jgi:hypothetical protein
MKVLFVAGFGAIVREMQSSLRFYRDAIALAAGGRGGVMFR